MPRLVASCTDVKELKPRERTTTARRRATDRTHNIDRHVGARIRERRRLLGLTQTQLAELVGVAYQQFAKYESASNRISASRLFEIARVLGVDVGSFFEGLDVPDEDLLGSRERQCLELTRNFSAIPNEQQQAALSQLARVLASK